MVLNREDGNHPTIIGPVLLHEKKSQSTHSLFGGAQTLAANKRKTGGLNYSKAITFGMPAGRGRKGDRPPWSRRGKQSASVVLPRNPSSSVVATDESQNYPDGAQLHNLYPAPGPPSVAAHQMSLDSLYNPPSFPIHGSPFPLTYASTFQAHLQNVPSQAVPPYRPFSSFQPSAAAGSWHSDLSPHSYYLVALPKRSKSATDAVTCSKKNFVYQHTTSWSSTWIGVWYAETTTQGR